MKLPILAFLLSLGLTVLFTPLVKRLAEKYGAVAVPRERDIHKKPLARWGGLSMYIAFMLTIVTVWCYLLFSHSLRHPHLLHQIQGLLIGATLVAIVGALDDKYELNAAYQSVALIIAAIILIGFGVRIEGITDPLASSIAPQPDHHYDPRSWIPFSAPLSAVLTIFWVVGVTKTVDFMDGLDGLASGICAISGFTLALMAAQAGQYEVSIIAATLTGVCVGFLRHNYNPASIIMGTIGAQFLGFLLAGIAMIGTFKIAATLSVALPILVLGVPIFDGIRVVTQRILKSTPAYLPDRTSHLHHILINRGYTQRQTVLIIWGVVAAACVFAFVIFKLNFK